MSDGLARLANACILPGFAGLTPPEWLRRELDKGLGGVVLFGRNVRDRAQLAALCGDLRATRETVIAIDEEGGDVTRLEVGTGSSLPGNLALGAVDDVSLTERVGRALARELRDLGVTHDLAPVADVNTNPRNPVIGVRAFGADPSHAARHVAAFVTGLQRGGVTACAKHFPGHGATEVDSHLGLPTVTTTREALLENELVPFRAAIAAGTRAIMTAHVVVPAIDEAPATLSRAHLTGLLRDELGFTGMIVTDALEMQAVSAGVGMGEGAVRALAAGADALCLGHDIDADHVARVRAALVGAVRAGRLSAERLEQAAERNAASFVPRPGVADHPASLREIGMDAARRALRVEGPVATSGPLLVVELAAPLSVAAGLAWHDLGSILAQRGADAAAISVGSATGDLVELVAAHPGRRPILVVRDPERHGWQRELADAFVAARPDAVVVDVGYPGWRPASAGLPILTTFGAGRANLVAAAERLSP